MTPIADNPVVVPDRERKPGESEPPRIRCPLCGWSPRKEDHWFCECSHSRAAYTTFGKEALTPQRRSGEENGRCSSMLVLWAQFLVSDSWRSFNGFVRCLVEHQKIQAHIYTIQEFLRLLRLCGVILAIRVRHSKRYYSAVFEVTEVFMNRLKLSGFAAPRDRTLPCFVHSPSSLLTNQQQCPDVSPKNNRVQIEGVLPFSLAI